ncbi:MAG: excinuclease ABC subunit UvrA [Anaerolineales bacterium]|nr:excinuclease ABC subunit UvrA [Anaerolineales bacterium]
MSEQIRIRGARLHNLKNLDLDLPKNKLIVFSGLSGSGKSTLVFDILHKEGQRQYLESLGMVTHQNKPPLDRIEGLSPSISIGQEITNHSPRSTVGTATEVFTYLRVLFARLGRRPCPHCGKSVEPSYLPLQVDWSDESGGQGSSDCPHCGKSVPELSMADFSFNKPDGACPACTGLGVTAAANLSKLVDETKTIAEGAITGWEEWYVNHYSKKLRAAAKYYGFPLDLEDPIRKWNDAARDLLFFGVEDPRFRRHFPKLKPAKTNAQGMFEGVATNLLRRHAAHIQDEAYREKVEKFLIRQTCPDCGGTRLKPESRAVTVEGKSIVEAARMPIAGLSVWLEGLTGAVPPEASPVLAPILDDLRAWIRRLVDVGVGYLTLERSSPTVSAGEAQRLRLAALLGSGLTGVLYVLDEPTIGMHPRDTGRMIAILRGLRDLGNTVLVIEHDLEMIRAADHLVEIGPGAGRLGGKVVAAGPPDRVAAGETATGKLLSGRISMPARPRRPLNGKALVIRGAREHNLKNLTVSLPVGLFTAVTGPSGSGKSTLLFDILDPAARKRYSGTEDAAGTHDSIDGWENFERIITVDQSPIGRSSRSNAATYTDTFTPIREAFAALPEARKRKFSPRHFSFNVPGGRCERCEGAGVLLVPMQLLPHAEVRCPACRGGRFLPETLAVRYNGCDISEVLAMTIEEVAEVFKDVPDAASRLELMMEVGLGYLPLGQPANTLSGGEAQRIKLAKELGKRGGGRTLYLLDEPTTGLHAADAAKLVALLHRLVGAGNTVAVIEHNLELVHCADWVIDLGPEGGDAGGYLVAQGTPEQVAAAENSATGKWLRNAVDV